MLRVVHVSLLLSCVVVVCEFVWECYVLCVDRCCVLLRVVVFVGCCVIIVARRLLMVIAVVR